MFCDLLFCTPKLLSRDKGVFKAETERCQRVSVGVEVDKRKLGKTKAIVIFASQGIYGEQSDRKPDKQLFQIGLTCMNKASET